MTTRARASAVARTFDERAQRAAELARSTPTAREPLAFASGLLRAQADVAEALESAHARAPWSGRSIDLERWISDARSIARFAAEHGPDALADEAARRVNESDEIALTRLELYARGDQTAADDYLSRAILRPYVEVLRSAGVAFAPLDRGGSAALHARSVGRCPFCGSQPSVALRRTAIDGAESSGTARSLVCSLCALEWSFPRILCPACAEKSPEKLPSFASDSHRSARIEACETCRRYVKSLRVEDARCVPEVDDLASLALDLWAVERGFARIEPGLAGL